MIFFSREAPYAWLSALWPQVHQRRFHCSLLRAKIAQWILIARKMWQRSINSSTACQDSLKIELRQFFAMYHRCLLKAVMAQCRFRDLIQKRNRSETHLGAPQQPHCCQRHHSIQLIRAVDYTSGAVRHTAFLLARCENSNEVPVEFSPVSTERSTRHSGRRRL